MKFKIQNSKILKSLMYCGFLCFLLFTFYFLLLTSSADAAYTIYLKNGSVITGVSRYEKSGGEIKFYFGGGIIGIPEADILKIEGGKEPVKDIGTAGESTQKKPVPAKPETREDAPGAGRGEETSDIKPQPEEPDKKSQEIARKEAELKKVEGDLLTTRARIQNLFGKSSSGSITEAERSMLQQNMMRKRKLEDEKTKLEEELKELRK
ncbi:MAG: hypothetical protein EPN94_00220 [Nitrospirae bacterium]|nr:MAG: hypothetical protein EPN94_00220 [Nitrospirota bacterium]